MLKFRTRVYPVCVCIVAFVSAVCAQSTPLASCTVPPSSVVPYTGTGNGPGVCPSEFWNATAQTNPSYCYSATMHCANVNTPDLNFIFSYDTPTVSPLKGTIVFFAGGGGTLGQLSPEGQFAQDYFTNGYEIVQIAWNTDWEQSADSLHILTAAGRPAGFLNYVLSTPLLNAQSVNPRAAVCAQGGSAGSAALGYSLVWYGDSNGNYLSKDLSNVELMVGPVLSRIDSGCYVPPAGQNTTTIGICYSPQYGCTPATKGWSNLIAYIDGYAEAVRTWTNDNTCANGAPTSSASAQSWLAESIVTGTGGNFNYPTTSMAGWLCSTYITGTCTGGNACPNNSSSEGEEFYNQFTTSSQASSYQLTGMLLCNGAEGVAGGTDPDNPQQTGAEARSALAC